MQALGEFGARFLWSGRVAALVTLGVLLAFYWTPPVYVPVGELDSLVFRHFHELETIGDLTFRWTAGMSTIMLPQVGQPAAGVLFLRVWSPDTRPTTPLIIAHDGVLRLSLPISPGLRSVTVLLPRGMVRRGDVRLDLLSAPWSPVNDVRPLGVGITELAWHGYGPTWPPARQLVVLPMLALAVASLLGRLHYPPAIASLTGAAVGVMVAVWAASRPLAVAPYSVRLLLIACLAHGVLWLWAAVAHREQGPWRAPTQVTSTQLVILWAVSYWMFVPFQSLLCVETRAQVCPRTGTWMIGLGTLAGLIMLIAWPALTPARRRHLGLVTVGLSSIAAGIAATTFAFQRSGPDFFIHWRAAYDFSLGRPLYQLTAIRANHFGHVFKLPPFYLLFLLPFTTAGDDLALLGHRVINVVLLLASGGLLAKMLTRSQGWTQALASSAVVVGLMQPAYDTIAYGQTDILLLLLLVLAWIGLRDDRPWLVGLPLACAISFKVYPLLLLGLLVIRRTWRSLAWTTLGLLLCNGLAIMVFGWRYHLVWLTDVLPSLQGGTSWVENQTINGFLSRLILGTMHIEPIHDLWIDRLTYSSFVVVAGITFLLALAPAERCGSSLALQYGSLAVVLVLAVPAAWMHYATITILPFMALIRQTAERPVSMRQASLLALAFGLIAYGNQWSFFTGTRHPGLPALALSYKGYGLALLWGVLVSTRWPLLRQALLSRKLAPGHIPP